MRLIKLTLDTHYPSVHARTYFADVIIQNNQPRTRDKQPHPQVPCYPYTKQSNIRTLVSTNTQLSSQNFPLKTIETQFWRYFLITDIKGLLSTKHHSDPVFRE